eukprot:380915-Hanusia_phi.AAC.1
MATVEPFRVSYRVTEFAVARVLRCQRLAQHGGAAGFPVRLRREGKTACKSGYERIRGWLHPSRSNSPHPVKVVVSTVFLRPN